MAQPAQTPFAVDSDITPLQGRFFNSVTSNISDPNLRSQLYDKVRSTFGGIQQARDIQRAKAQEDEDRSIGLELRRAQLDQSKLELGLARDKVRQQQEASALGLPCLVLRAVTETVEPSDSSVRRSEFRQGVILDFIESHNSLRRDMRDFSQSPSQIIANYLHENY